MGGGGKSSSNIFSIGKGIGISLSKKFGGGINKPECDSASLNCGTVGIISSRSFVGTSRGFVAMIEVVILGVNVGCSKGKGGDAFVSV